MYADCIADVQYPLSFSTMYACGFGRCDSEMDGLSIIVWHDLTTYRIDDTKAKIILHPQASTPLFPSLVTTLLSSPEVRPTNLRKLYSTLLTSATSRGTRLTSQGDLDFRIDVIPVVKVSRCFSGKDGGRERKVLNGGNGDSHWKVYSC